MIEWTERRLGNIVTFQRGHDLIQTKFITGEYPVAGSNGIIDFHNEFTTVGPGLTLGRSGNSIGIAHYYEKNFWAHNTTLYSKEFIDSYPKYIYYLLKTIDFSTFNTGSAVPSLNRNHIHEILVLVPPLTEQKAIASILTSLDDKIDLLHRQNATLEAMAETLFRQWFVEEAKEEWPITTLDQHVDVSRGLSYKGSGLSEKGIGLPMHNLNSVYEGGGYKSDGIKYYSGLYKPRHLVHPGDIIVTNTEQGHEHRLIGFPAIVPDTFGEVGLFSQHIYKVKPLNSTYLTNEFVYYLLMTSSVREQITAATNGSTVNMLAIDGLQRPEFKLPPKQLVKQFTEITKSYWDKKNLNQKQIRTHTKLRDTLLPKLMSGEVRVRE